MLENDLLLGIAKELYLEETGLYVASDSKVEWERVKRQFPQRYSLCLWRAKAYMHESDNLLIKEAQQADFRSLTRQFIMAEKHENISASEFLSGVYGLNDADGFLLYIGESEDIFARLKQHRRDGKDFKTVQYVETFENKFLRKHLETHLRNSFLFKPPLNRQGVGPRRASTTHG